MGSAIPVGGLPGHTGPGIGDYVSPTVLREQLKAQRELDENKKKRPPDDKAKKDYDHPRGSGGAGGSPCKFRKREGGLEDKRIIHGMKMR